jgi:hypothetical protein
MTNLTTSLRPKPRPAAAPAQEMEKPAATLITEQQVLFSTAAAVALPTARTSWWSDTIESVTAAVWAFFDGSNTPVQKHHPKRYSYLENALMAREMGRL